MLSVKEVNYYNSLVKRGLANKISCPFDEVGVLDHIVITKIASDDESATFKCVTCNSKFDAGINTIESVKSTIDKYKN